MVRLIVAATMVAGLFGNRVNSPCPNGQCGRPAAAAAQGPVTWLDAATLPGLTPPRGDKPAAAAPATSAAKDLVGTPPATSSTPAPTLAPPARSYHVQAVDRYGRVLTATPRPAAGRERSIVVRRSGVVRRAASRRGWFARWRCRRACR